MALEKPAATAARSRPSTASAPESPGSWVRQRCAVVCAAKSADAGPSVRSEVQMAIASAAGSRRSVSSVFAASRRTERGSVAAFAP